MFVYKHTETIELAHFLRKIQTLGVNNSRILTIEKAKLLGYYFYTNLNIREDFQISICVPLIFLIKIDGCYNLKYFSWFYSVSNKWIMQVIKKGWKEKKTKTDNNGNKKRSHFRVTRSIRLYSVCILHSTQRSVSRSVSQFK